MWMFPRIVVPQNGWFIRDNPIKMDDLGVPLFLETPMEQGFPILPAGASRLVDFWTSCDVKLLREIQRVGWSIGVKIWCCFLE